MTRDERVKVKIDSEMRTKEISKMIGEGGLGAEEYYEIKKSAHSVQNNTEEDTREKEDKK
ncbi:hypothetical protein [Sporosarcina sp. FA9]|uniref:hypothetical protein n=1 Tax=Sporosarcina sp. FA9 TaxID=3413030 RepID=UPI003F6557D9